LFLLGVFCHKDDIQSIDQDNDTLDITFEELKYYLTLSYAAYCTKPNGNLSNWGCYWCKGIDGKIQGTVAGGLDIFGYILLTSTEIIISFRGSQSLKNWIANLEFFKSRLSISKM